MDEKYKKLMVENEEWFANPIGMKTIKVETFIPTIERYEKENNVEVGIIYEDNYVMLLKDLVTFPNNKMGTYIRLMPKRQHTA